MLNRIHYYVKKIMFARMGIKVVQNSFQHLQGVDCDGS